MANLMLDYDVVVIGAGAAGMMCAATAGQRGRRVLLVEHYPIVGEKIRISGGGRCNFTNLWRLAQSSSPADNPNFHRSALARYTPQDFIDLIEAHRIAYHEKKLGQLFCDETALAIVAMLKEECAARQRAMAHALRGERHRSRTSARSSSRPRKVTCAARRW